MEDELNEEDNNFFQKLQAADLKSVDKAMNRLIDTVSKFKSVESLEELTPEDFIEMLWSLDHASFVVSGIMYSYGLNVYEDCEHEHDEEEDEE